MAEELKKQWEDPKYRKMSGDERIQLLISAESDVRRSKKISRIVNASGLRYPGAVIDREIMAQQGADCEKILYLSECSWIKRAENLLITGKTGAGKTYCACALALAAASRYKTIRYEKAGDLLRRLERAEYEKRLTETLDQYKKYDLLIIDDFGLMPLTANMCRNLFELIDGRDGYKSTVLVSQFPVGAWYELFENSTYADACLDRIVRGANRLEFSGESLRGTAAG